MKKTSFAENDYSQKGRDTVMGFLSKAFDVFVSICEYSAKKIDRMSDDDIEQKLVSKDPDKTVHYYRNAAANAHRLANRRRNNDDD